MSNEPVLLELAHLPREQVGPFLLLGLDKDASKEDIEAHWAERIKWARKQQTNLTLEEINWARDLVSDPVRRVTADATSLNLDTTEGTLATLATRYGAEKATPSWEPIDEEKPLADFTPPVEVPDLEATRQAVAVPEVPCRFPVAASLLAKLAGQALDPWEVSL
jgi:hypothetical protein